MTFYDIVVTYQHVSCRIVTETGGDSLEDTVFADMLRIVDDKFDSLSARISILERSINSLNFYNVRQFRHIHESLDQSNDLSSDVIEQVCSLSLYNLPFNASLRRNRGLYCL